MNIENVEERFERAETGVSLGRGALTIAWVPGDPGRALPPPKHRRRCEEGDKEGGEEVGREGSSIISKTDPTTWEKEG